MCKPPVWKKPVAESKVERVEKATAVEIGVSIVFCGIHQFSCCMELLCSEALVLEIHSAGILCTFFVKFVCFFGRWKRRYVCYCTNKTASNTQLIICQLLVMSYAKYFGKIILTDINSRIDGNSSTRQYFTLCTCDIGEVTGGVGVSKSNFYRNNFDTGTNCVQCCGSSFLPRLSISVSKNQKLVWNAREIICSKIVWKEMIIISHSVLTKNEALMNKSSTHDDWWTVWSNVKAYKS